MSERLPPIPVAELAAIGPFFALSPGGHAAGPGWQLASALLADRELLNRIIGQVAAQLGTSQRWIAASLFYQGWAARLTSVYAGSAVLCGAVPDLGADKVRYRLRQPGPIDLCAEPLEARPATAGWRRLHDDHLDPLAAAIRREVRIGRYLLRGNVASALAGALGAVAAARGERPETLIGQDWARPADLAGSGRWRRAPGGLHYARATCCGYEQLSQGARCADCSLNWHGLAGTG